MVKSSVSAELKALRERAGLSVRALADIMGVPQSTYSNYESRYKKRHLPMDFAEALARALSGTGVQPDEIMALAGVSVPVRVDASAIVPSGAKLVPVYDLAASAGFGSLVEYETVAYSMAFPPSYLEKLTRSHPKNLAIISVKGESMLPTLKDDDIVMVDMSKRNIGYDGMFVVRHLDVVKVKRLRLSPDRTTISLISDNSAVYPPETWPAEEVEIVGRVIWVGGKV